MKDYYQLELDDMVIALENKDAEIEHLQKKLEIAVKALEEIGQHYSPEYNKGGEISHKALKEIDLVGTSSKED